MNKEETLNRIYQLIASVRTNGAYPAENFIEEIIDNLIKTTEKESYLRMASRINSHGFIGLMTGKYELKEIK